jgi:hypothetical protein
VLIFPENFKNPASPEPEKPKIDRFAVNVDTAPYGAIRGLQGKVVDPAPAGGYLGCTQHKAVYSPSSGFAACGVPEIPTGFPASAPYGPDAAYGLAPMRKRT